MQDNCAYPCVSIVVMTYNSSGTIIDTLESIKNQTYNNIELVITDDCSTDSTILITREWLESNRSRFADSRIVTSTINTGVSANLNRGVRSSKGEWIKSIAGDDLLVPEAIEEFMDYVFCDTNARMCISDVEPFVENGVVPNRIIERYEDFFRKECEPYEMQRRRVMSQLVFVGPTYFYSRNLFEEVGGFSEKYGCAEEWPFVYKVIMAGNRIFPIKKKLVRYRVQESSLSHFRDKRGLGSQRFLKSMYQFYFDVACKDLLHEGRILTAWHYALLFWGWKLQYKTNNLFLINAITFLTSAFSPLSYLWKLNLVKRI